MLKAMDLPTDFVRVQVGTTPRTRLVEEHDCHEHAIGHDDIWDDGERIMKHWWDCSICGNFLQSG